NKSDLVSKRKADKGKKLLNEESVFVSAKKKMGKTKLKEAIGKLIGNKDVKIAVAGYPNTGKSSLINMLKGKKSAPTSSTAGFTRGVQLIRISKKIMLVDSPGVIPFTHKDEGVMALLGAKSPERIKDLEGTGLEIAQELIKQNKDAVEELYGVKANDGEELLEEIAFKRKKLMKGGKPNIIEAARILISDLQKGKIGL
ncbi:MAG: 50S ribosome-binding GTPase, partial [Candidatus Diapherotrites archaeon]|nr:50S ribosome-binding GTPase [Candidatus Diapherotrites archaeon]